MAEKICAAAVDAATYAIDKLYSYRVPDELREQVQIGTRVLVPFGFGNKRAEAVVLAFREDAGEFKLKPIVEVLDETPILTAEQLETRGVDAGEIVLHLLRLRTRHAARRLVVQAKRDVHARAGRGFGGSAGAGRRRRSGAGAV